MEELKKYWLLVAYNQASKSPDLSTQNGAIIVDKSWEDGNKEIKFSFASNTFPPLIKSTPERLQYPLKRDYIEHAERGAIYDASLKGIATENATMFCPWFACVECSRAIICSGIKQVIGHQDMMDKTPDRWKESIKVAFDLLNEAGVKTELIVGKLGGPLLRFNSEIWEP